jgi:hypothetical protein
LELDYTRLLRLLGYADVDCRGFEPVNTNDDIERPDWGDMKQKVVESEKAAMHRWYGT